MPKKRPPIELLRTGGLLVRDKNNVVYFIEDSHLGRYRRDDLKSKAAQKAIDDIFASFDDECCVELKNAGLFKFVIMSESGDGGGG